MRGKLHGFLGDDTVGNRNARKSSARYTPSSSNGNGSRVEKWTINESGRAQALKGSSHVNKQYLHSTIQNTMSHNRREEIKDCWREYDLQKKEAAYRKILVIAEDDGTVRPKSIEELFDDVRNIHFLSYIRYLYFNIGRIAYLQANVLSAYVFLAPAIVAGAVTLGVMQQIIRAFGRVEGSMQYILKAWPTIIELASVYKRLREFEYKLKIENSESEIKT